MSNKTTLFSLIIDDVLAGRHSGSMINLNQIPIGSPEVQRLKEMLASEYGRKIMGIELSGCHINDWVAAELADVIANNATLEMLDLLDNPLSANGVRFLLSACKSNGHIRMRLTEDEVYKTELETDLRSFDRRFHLIKKSDVRLKSAADERRTVIQQRSSSSGSDELSHERQSLRARHLATKRHASPRSRSASPGESKTRHGSLSPSPRSSSGSPRSLLMSPRFNEDHRVQERQRKRKLALVQEQQQFEQELLADTDIQAYVTEAVQREIANMDRMRGGISKAEQRIKDLEEKIRELSQKQTNSTAQSEENWQAIRELQVKHDKAREVQRKIENMLATKSNKIRMREAYQQQEPNAWEFYRTFLIKFEEVVLGLKAVASGQAEISGQDKDTMGYAGAGVKLFGRVVKLVPLVGEAAGGVVENIGRGMIELDKLQMINLKKSFSRLGTLDEFQEVAEEVARVMTERYLPQLTRLRSLDEEIAAAQRSQQCGTFFQKSWAKIKHKVAAGKKALFKEGVVSPSQQFADFLVVQVIDAMCDKEYNDVNMLATDILKTLTVAPDERAFDSRAKRKFSKAFNLHTLVTKDEQSWYMGDICLRAGLQIGSVRYVNDKMQPDIYGYCRASEEDLHRHSGLQSEGPLPSAPQKSPRSSNPSWGNFVGQTQSELDRLRQAQELRDRMLQMRSPREGSQSSPQIYGKRNSATKFKHPARGSFGKAPRKPLPMPESSGNTY